MISRTLAFFVASLILLGSMEVAGQNRKIVYKGRVLDRDSKMPLKGANLTIAGSKKGTTSGVDGTFSITIYNLPVTLKVSYVGYEQQLIWIGEDTPSITVLLARTIEELKEVEVKAKTEPVPFYRDNRFAVLDYEVDSGLVYLLIYRYRKANSMLLVMDVPGDTVAHSEALSGKPSELFRDCLGNIHLLSADSAWQVVLRDDHAELHYPVELKRFLSVLPGCVAATDSLLVIRKASPNGLVVNFEVVDRKSSRKKFLHASRDEYKLSMLRRAPYDNYLLMLDSIPDDFSTAVYMHWLKKIIYKPNASSLHRIGDLIYVFNTIDYVVRVYTLPGDFTCSLKMPVEKIADGKWTKEIYVDEIRHNAYTTFRRGGLFTLFRIDLNTGDCKRQLSPVHDFPGKIRVHGGHLFYLYDVPGEGDNRHLFRQKL